MNNLTVTTLFNPARTNAQGAYIARIVARAQRLEADGYELYKTTCAGHYDVANPNDPAFPFPSYAVNLNAGREKCTCEGFAKDGDCKHRIACAIRENAFQEEMDVIYTEKAFAEWEAQMAETEMWDAICADVDARAAQEA